LLIARALSLVILPYLCYPKHEDFPLGGRILFHLSQELGTLDFRAHFRDGLIAVRAARIGGTVVTENGGNFELWRDGLARSGRRLALSVVGKK
jgi:hypothetical protein